MSRTTNGIGWEVQEYLGTTSGWVAVTRPLKLETAKKYLAGFKYEYPMLEYRIYESLS